MYKVARRNMEKVMIEKHLYIDLFILFLVSSVLGDPYVIITDKLPENKNFMSSIGNGYIASVVMSDSIHVAGVYNGHANVKPETHSQRQVNNRTGGKNDWISGHTHRARIPSTIAINFTTNLPATRIYSQDMRNGIFLQVAEGEDFQIKHSLFAHRKYKHIFCNILEIESNVDLLLKLYSNEGNHTEDFDYQIVENKYYNGFVGMTKESEYEGVNQSRVAMVWSKIPKEISVYKSNRVIYFTTAVVSSLGNDDPFPEAVALWEQSVLMKRDLLIEHKEAWEQMWQNGSIDIDGDAYIQKVTIASLYNLYSSVCDTCNHGVSPSGLPTSYEYLGHTFWDQETWMFPPILMYHPHIAKLFLQYRIDRLNSAKQIAEKYGFKGAMYPWESAVSGLEVCPEEVYGRNEIHITADIMFAMKQYFLATQDFDWLEKEAFPVIYEAALFWASRVKYKDSVNHYVIDDVMPPDEYQYPVNNSVYTNVLCKTVMEFAIDTAKALGKNIPEEWYRIVAGLFIPYNDTLDYHPEFDGFDILNKSTIVKQADVILINYPLLFQMNEQTKINDLMYYESVTTENGPAMTYSMFTIGWLDVNEKDKARKAFEKSFDHIELPFYVWSEVKGGEGAANFLTGVGGYLQSITNGYFGVRLTEKGLSFKMTSLPNTSFITIKGLKYLGGSFELSVSNDSRCSLVMTHTLTKRTFWLRYASGSSRIRLKKTYHVCKAIISVIK